MSERTQVLTTYLNDHLAGSVAAIELLEHLRELSKGTERERLFVFLQSEIEQDQSVLTHRPTAAPRSASEPTAGWVLYDGDCGVCSRWVSSWGPALQRRGLAIAPLQSAWVQERTGLRPADLLTDIRLLQPSGRLLSGAEVYRYMMRRIWWAYPLYLLSKVPGLSQLFEWAYRTFARHRMQISASCGLPRAD